MNRFRTNLHPALFDSSERSKDTNEILENGKKAIEDAQTLPEAKKAYKEAKKDLEKKAQEELHQLQTSVRNNESLGTAIETKEKDLDDKELAKQLKQLAKNKKINFEWTDDAWKCSRAEKKLATWSAKVFQQLLDNGKLQDMINLCKSHVWELTKEEAERWKKDLSINSKVTDIQKFYTAYLEYQNPASEFQHLKNLMWFFCENDFSQIENGDYLYGVKERMKTRSKKITKKERNEKAKELYNTDKTNNSSLETTPETIPENTEPVVKNLQNGEGLTKTLEGQQEQQSSQKRPKDWKQRANFEIIKDRLSNDVNLNTIDKMMRILWDFNLDGEVNSGDVGYKTWTQLAEKFKEFDKNKAVNLIQYANKFGIGPDFSNDDGHIDLVDSLYEWMTDKEKWYENTRSLQNFLRYLPIELSDVLANWADAWEESLRHIVSAINLENSQQPKEKQDSQEEKTREDEKGEKKPKIERKKEEYDEKLMELAKVKTEEILKNWQGILNKTFPKESERTEIMEQLRAQLPSMLIDKAAWVHRWLAAGYEVPLDEILKWLSAWFNGGVDSNGKLKFWLFIWLSKEYDLSKTTKLKAAISAGTKLLFIPCVATTMVIKKNLNEKQLKETLDPESLKSISVWGNVSWTWPIFSWWVSAGRESDKLEGIEKQAKSMKDVLKKQAFWWIEELKKLEPESGNKVTLEQKRNKLIELLGDQYKKTSPSKNSLETAANNLLSIISWFKFDEKIDSKEINTYAQVIADVYSNIWRNAAVAWIADNKRRVSWWKVGLQFIAWFVPVVSGVLEFAKYRNARTNETEHSRMARINAQINGEGNKNLFEWTDKRRIWTEELNQINNSLKKYWAKENLILEWQTDIAPGRIVVPASIVNGVWINVRVAKTMQWYVKEENNWYSFPANGAYRLLEESGWNQKSVTLNIGSGWNSTSDIMISDKTWMDQLIGESEIKTEHKERYNNKVTQIKLENEPDFSDLFGDKAVVEGLKTIDSSNRRNFSEFMSNKTAAKKEFKDMVDALIKVLGNNPLYGKIREKLSSSDIDDAYKQLIIDRIMAISASANVHEKSWLEANIKQRWNYYKRDSMSWPNGKSIFNKLEANRDEFIKDLTEYSSEKKPNLLWATAFYHRNNTSKWLALTWLGVTTALWWKTQELTGKDAEVAKNWFLWWLERAEKGNLSPEKSPAEWSNLKKVIDSKLSNGITLSDKQLQTLLEKGEVILDNHDKKPIIRLDVKYVFYLMWECANESVGMEFENISIQEQEEYLDYNQWEFYVNNVEWSSTVNVVTKNGAVGVAFGWQSNNGDNNSAHATYDATEWGQQIETGDDLPETPTPPPVAEESVTPPDDNWQIE